MEEQKKLQVRHYKSMANHYDVLYHRDNRNHVNKVAAISNYLNLKPHSRVLEIGVGTGIHAKYLLEWNSARDIDFTGVDLSIDMLRVCADRLQNYHNINLYEMDGESLAFSDNAFDAAYILGSLHHFNDCFKGISELIRCIKPNSKFAIMEPTWIFPSNFLASKIFPADKNISLMKKANFEKWLSTFLGLSYNIQNFAYTPPFPKSFIKFYDCIDSFLAKIPIVHNISVMIFITGKKL